MTDDDENESDEAEAGSDGGSSADQADTAAINESTSYFGRCDATCTKCVEQPGLQCTLGSKHKDDGFPHSCAMHHTW